MKTKSAAIWGIIFFFLFLIGIFIERQLNIPPFPEELTTIAISETNSLKDVSQREKIQIITNILGSDGQKYEQLFFLRNSLPLFTQNVESVRYLNFVLLLFALLFLLLTLRNFKQSNVILIATMIFAFCSPLFFNLWVLHPKISLTIFLVNFWVYLKFCGKNNRMITILMLLTTLLLFFASFQGFFIGIIFTIITLKSQLKSKNLLATVITLGVFVAILTNASNNSFLKKTFFNLPVVNHATLSYVGEEITARIGQEDSLKEKISFPLWFRRIGYNKIFFIYKNISIDLVNFFDPETWFFQEVHPLQQKSEIIFFWPEIILFIIGLVALVKSKEKEIQKLVIFLFSLSLLFFLTTINESPSVKYSLLLFCFPIIISYGLLNRYKIITSILIILSLWGLVIGYYDLKKRPLFLFDNRPYIYSWSIQKLTNLDNFNTTPELIEISSLVGNPKLYFLYYFKARPSLFLPKPNEVVYNNRNYFFNSFDLKINRPINKTLYLGFLGEYVGSNPKNEFSYDQEFIKIKNSGIEIKDIWKTNDTIAYKYSDYFILGYYP